MMEGCQGAARLRTPTWEEKKCPRCGNMIEIFSCDSQMACVKCGFVIYNDQLSCVKWCPKAKECVGEEMYNMLMQVGEKQKGRQKETA